MEKLNDALERLARCEKENIELRSRVEELSDFFENAALPLHWVDSNGIIIWANQAELDTLGFTREEYIGAHINAFHVDQETILEILNRLSNNETLHNYPAKLRHKDGSIRHVLISSNVLRKDGKFIHTRCFTRDVTPMIAEAERKADLLNELEESEARLKMAIRSTNLGTWDWSPVTGELYWSDECKRIYGLPPDEPVTFEVFSDHIHPEDRERVQEAIEKSIARDSDGSYDIIYRILWVNDHLVRWIRVQGMVSFNGDRQAERFIGTVVDITDLKEAEEKSARLAAIIESTDDAIISKTLEGIITSWNDSAERTFGYTAEEMIGQSILKLIPADRQEEEPRILSRLRKGERVEHFETKRVKKDGSLLDVSLTISPVKDERGNIIGLSKIARDITEKKQEEQRKHDFVAMVSHELKTPLTSIISYLQVMIARSVKEGNEFTANALARTETQAKKMGKMIQDFLNLARLEEGKILIVRETFELLPLMKEVAGDAQFLTIKHKIRLQNCDEIVVNADKDKIGHVLMNLLSNAIKYSPGGGTISLGCILKQGKVKIYVSDEGVGISQADQQRLFERFYRVNNDKLRSISGFGIGLFLASEILRYHNSKIEVESKEGLGSTFYFYLDL
jgi:two-component system, OmpR family, sensor histidine kinase VicK